MQRQNNGINYREDNRRKTHRIFRASLPLLLPGRQESAKLVYRCCERPNFVFVSTLPLSVGAPRWYILRRVLVKWRPHRQCQQRQQHQHHSSLLRYSTFRECVLQVTREFVTWPMHHLSRARVGPFHFIVSE